MKIIKNTLEVITSVWEDPGDYPNALARGPLPSHLCVDDISGYLLIQVEKSDKENDDFEGCKPDEIMQSLMEDHTIKVDGVVVTSWQFCPKEHPNSNDAAGLDLWKIIPYKWDADRFEL